MSAPEADSCAKKPPATMSLECPSAARRSLALSFSSGSPRLGAHAVVQAQHRRAHVRDVARRGLKRGVLAPAGRLRLPASAVAEGSTTTTQAVSTKASSRRGASKTNICTSIGTPARIPVTPRVAWTLVRGVAPHSVPNLRQTQCARAAWPSFARRETLRTLRRNQTLRRVPPQGKGRAPDLVPQLSQGLRLRVQQSDAGAPTCPAQATPRGVPRLVCRAQGRKALHRLRRHLPSGRDAMGSSARDEETRGSRRPCTHGQQDSSPRGDREVRACLCKLSRHPYICSSTGCSSAWLERCVWDAEVRRFESGHPD